MSEWLYHKIKKIKKNTGVFDTNEGKRRRSVSALPMILMATLLPKHKDDNNKSQTNKKKSHSLKKDISTTILTLNCTFKYCLGE